MYKLYIFDLDGTLLNTLDDLADAVNHTLRENGYPCHTVDEIRSYVGNGVRKLIERSLPPHTTEAETERIIQQYKAYYAEHSADKTKPYDGILPMLKRLRDGGCKIAVLSNKQDEAVKPLCKHYFPGLLDLAMGNRANIPHKPAPDAVYAILDALECPPEQAVYIGDSEVDIETASNAKIDCISVDWGFRDRDFLLQCGAKTVLSHPNELN